MDTVCRSNDTVVSRSILPRMSVFSGLSIWLWVRIGVVFLDRRLSLDSLNPMLYCYDSSMLLSIAVAQVSEFLD